MKTNRNKMITDFNEAFAKSDVDTILQYVTEDIKWNMIGDRIVEGKENFSNFIKEMASQDTMDFSLDPLITKGQHAISEGRMTSPAGKVYAFCDLYTFDDSEENKVKSLTSYVIELPE